MVLNLVQLEESLVFQTGQDVMAGNGVVLFGMSPGNPYFKSHVIEDYVEGRKTNHCSCTTAAS